MSVRISDRAFVFLSAAAALIGAGFGFGLHGTLQATVLGASIGAVVPIALVFIGIVLS